MKLNRKGFVFRYHGDEVIRYWPWVSRKLGSTYHSYLFSMDFNSLAEYWKLIKERFSFTPPNHNKINGFSLREVVAQWASTMWRNEYIIVMIEPNVQSKGPAFWSKLTLEQKRSLTEDIVVLRCKDFTEATTLIESIDPGFADAFMLLNGDIMNSNDETWDWSVNHRGVRAWS